MIKLSDYIVEKLLSCGVKDVFLVTGGGAMHLNDSIGHSKLHYYCNHHEQACAMAAEGYARISGKLGVICVTSGPGGINAINGVFGAWTDSIPMLIISGQVKRETCMASYNVPFRQLGDQEADIISMVKGITKYAKLVTDPKSIRYHLECALYLAVTGRHGPCWLDIPLDVQSAMIEPKKLKGYKPPNKLLSKDQKNINTICKTIIEKIKIAKQPVILPGTGIRLANVLDTFHRVIERLKIPVAPTWTAIDTLTNDSPLYAGRPGTVGGRAGNFCVQNADLLLILGSRLNVRQVSYNWKTFAPRAFKIQVDIDATELIKPTVQPNLSVNCDLKIFLQTMEKLLKKHSLQINTNHNIWLKWCQERVLRYPPVLPRHREWKGQINPYHFVEKLFTYLKNDDIVVCGNGSACVITFQAAKVKSGQRIFTNSGCASMGYDLPAAIGAAIAAKGQRIICLAGDGSIQMNIQELQTLKHQKLPIKIFILDNNGYSSIRQTQKSFFHRYIGESPNSGVSFPDMEKIAIAYGIPSCTLSKANFYEDLAKILKTPGATLSVIKLDPTQMFEPKISSKKMPDGKIISPPLEDMFPFLEKKEFKSNIIDN